MPAKLRTVLGIHHDIDPSAALVRGGKILAYSEEERHNRVKHAAYLFPSDAILSCLQSAGLHADDVDYIAVNWDLDAYTDGRIKAFYEGMRLSFSLDDATVAWQERNLRARHIDNYRKFLAFQWRRHISDKIAPDIISFPHHFTHAFHAYSQSKFDQALCLTLDGSGDTECTVLWRCRNGVIEPLRQFFMPHSLGWFYAAFTEYLGFEAYDGEYKVMGMAAYGQWNEKIGESLSQILSVDAKGGFYKIDPTFLHYGAHTFSSRYTDKIPQLFGIPPRQPFEEITSWHRDLAFCVQHKLEAAATALVDWGIRETGIGNICVSGGVGLNVKMNSKIFALTHVKDVFAHPLCSDNGAACGAALLGSYTLDQTPPEKLASLALGHSETSNTVRQILMDSKICFEEIPYSELPGRVARALADDMLVGWFQGRMEAGPRALGHRSILANPKNADARDRVNLVIKYRELWRPFCPSIISKAMPSYFDKYTFSPFMIIAFDANQRLVQEAPAIVHVDGTSRVQEVIEMDEPLYHALIEEFGKLTGSPVILNTSFNVKGEPIVCTALDALRTFFSTGLDLLAIENFIVRKGDQT